MKEEKQSLLQRCIKWRENNIKEKQFILILSFLVGIFTAIAALILKFLIHQIQNFLTNNFNATEANYLYLVYPVVGIFLSGWFVRNIVKDDISHGVTKILYAISRRQGRIKRHNICDNHRIRWFGGSGGAYRLDRFGYRFQSGKRIQNGTPHIDAACRLWGGRCHSRYL